jgi:hypothetical protein
MAGLRAGGPKVFTPSGILAIHLATHGLRSLYAIIHSERKGAAWD